MWEKRLPAKLSPTVVTGKIIPGLAIQMKLFTIKCTCTIMSFTIICSIPATVLVHCSIPCNYTWTLERTNNQICTCSWVTSARLRCVCTKLEMYAHFQIREKRHHQQLSSPQYDTITLNARQQHIHSLHSNYHIQCSLFTCYNNSAIPCMFIHTMIWGLLDEWMFILTMLYVLKMKSYLQLMIVPNFDVQWCSIDSSITHASVFIPLFEVVLQLMSDYSQPACVQMSGKGILTMGC